MKVTNQSAMPHMLKMKKQGQANANWFELLVSLIAHRLTKLLNLNLIQTLNFKEA